PTHDILYLVLYFTLFFFYCYRDIRDLHSFPTRRSSDLIWKYVCGRSNRLHGLSHVAPTSKHTERSIGCIHYGAECARQHIPFLRSEEHTSELQSRFDLVCRLLLEKKKKNKKSLKYHILS